jgi:hypothetical protein
MVAATFPLPGCETEIPEQLNPADQDAFDKAVQAWFADDGTIAGALRRLRVLWDILELIGPPMGYYPNGSKTFLVVKPGYTEQAREIFNGTEVKITEEGHRHLGAVIGTKAFVSAYMREKVGVWVEQIDLLAEIAHEYPREAHSCFTKGLQGKWNYFLRTIPSTSEYLDALDKSICSRLIPALLCRKEDEISEDLREAVAIASSLGGLGVGPVSQKAQEQYGQSRAATAPLLEKILAQEVELGDYPTKEINDAKRSIVREKEKQRKQLYQDFVTKEDRPEEIRIFTQHAAEPGASTWLAVLPIQEHGMDLSREQWEVAMAVRYGLSLPFLPTRCGCGQAFTIAHALQCALGCFIHWRHDDLRDFFISFMSSLYPDTRSEPTLKHLTEEEKRALEQKYKTSNLGDRPRGDCSALDFWQPGQRAYFDFRVWNHLALKYVGLTLAECHQMNEQEKEREYGPRIRNCENGAFTAIVFSSMASAGPGATDFVNALASRASELRSIARSQVLEYLRSKYGISLIKSQHLCIRGTHEKKDKSAMHSLTRLYPKRRGVMKLKPMYMRTDLGAMQDFIVRGDIPHKGEEASGSPGEVMPNTKLSSHHPNEMHLSHSLGDSLVASTPQTVHQKLSTLSAPKHLQVTIEHDDEPNSASHGIASPSQVSLTEVSPIKEPDDGEPVLAPYGNAMPSRGPLTNVSPILMLSVSGNAPCEITDLHEYVDTSPAHDEATQTPSSVRRFMDQLASEDEPVYPSSAYVRTSGLLTGWQPTQTPEDTHVNTKYGDENLVDHRLFSLPQPCPTGSSLSVQDYRGSVPLPLSAHPWPSLSSPFLSEYPTYHPNISPLPTSIDNTHTVSAHFETPSHLLYNYHPHPHTTQVTFTHPQLHSDTTYPHPDNYSHHCTVLHPHTVSNLTQHDTESHHTDVPQPHAHSQSHSHSQTISDIAQHHTEPHNCDMTQSHAHNQPHQAPCWDCINDNCSDERNREYGDGGCGGSVREYCGEKVEEGGSSSR